MNKKEINVDRERLRNYLWLRMYLPDGDEAAEVFFPDLHLSVGRGDEHDDHIAERTSRASESHIQ